MYKTEAGTLFIDATRSGGKVIEEWRFISPFRNKDAPKLSVKISIIKSTKNGFSFVAASESLPQPIVDTDINSLYQKVEAALRLQHDLLTGVTWEDWLEVEVRGTRDNRDVLQSASVDLRIKYQKLKRGVHPVTQVPYVINQNGIAVRFPSAKKAGEPDPDVAFDTAEFLPGSGIQGFGPGRELACEYSYLPATPENIAAIEDIMSRLESLHGALAAFLRQDVISTSLSGLHNIPPALVAPR